MSLVLYRGGGRSRGSRGGRVGRPRQDDSSPETQLTDENVNLSDLDLLKRLQEQRPDLILPQSIRKSLFKQVETPTNSKELSEISKHLEKIKKMETELCEIQNQVRFFKVVTQVSLEVYTSKFFK
jgi:hypothetical protein